MHDGWADYVGPEVRKRKDSTHLFSCVIRITSMGLGKENHEVCEYLTFEAPHTILSLKGSDRLFLT